MILVISIALATSIISYMHSNHQDQSVVAAKGLMARSSGELELRISSLILPIDTIAALSADWAGVSVAPTDMGHPERDRLLRLMRLRPQIANISLGFENGDFYLLGRTALRPAESLEPLNAPAEVAFLEQIILRDETPPRLIYRFLNEAGAVIGSTFLQDPEYDPRSRPWYNAALATETTTRTDAYIFAGGGTPGLTVSRQNEHGVVGVDITLGQLGEFLSRQPQAQQGALAVFTSEGELLARSDAETTEASQTEQIQSDEADIAVAALQTHTQIWREYPDSILDIQGRPWVVHIEPIPFGGETEELLAIALPLDVIAAPIARVSRNTTIVSIAIILTSIPIIWLVSRGLSRPLVSLAKSAERIGRFDLGGRVPVVSTVNEVRALQRAMAHMKKSLSIFSIYVPKALVKQLLEHDETPQLGGESRVITVLFTDIENFTAMSSDLDAEEVMRRMSRYFEAVTKVLLDHGATIDKYIGDAVMAFWNAPNDTPDQVERACAAALELVEVARRETDAWATPGKPPLRTRVGIHSGEAIVGNVGSSDRMNYTALGSTVNFAARLESLNRETGTEILVSHDVAQQVAGSFKTRDAGRASLKGFDATVEVYELVGTSEALDAAEDRRRPSVQR